MKERPRVLLLADSPYFGGIATHLMSIAQSMAGSPFEIGMATLPGRRDDIALIDACRREHMPIHEFQMAHAFDVAVVPQLRRYVVENGIGLVHTHNYRATLLARLAGLAVPVINTCHGAAAERSLRVKAWQWAELKAARRNRLTIACSDFVRQWLETRGLDGGRIRTIRNGYAPPAESKPVTRAEAGVREPDLLVFYAGRLCDGKGVECLVDAVSGMSGVTVLVDYGDVKGLRGALDRMKDAGARDAMGRRARLIWEERFTPERFAGELERAYSEALGS
jgi:glycosyltransferase involved in cell wall biosynthesis